MNHRQWHRLDLSPRVHARHAGLGLFAALSACTALQLLLPGTLRAYEDRATVGVAVGYAHASSPKLAHEGIALAVDASLGLGDSWTIRALASYSLHPGPTSLSVVTLGGELLYLVDVLELVPYFGAGLDAVARWASNGQTAWGELGVHPVVGLDWLLNRDLALGVAARPVFLFTDWARSPVYLTVTISASLLFDR